MRECGFDVDVVDDVRAIGAGRRVSSTWIREVLAEGDVETAAKLLGQARRRSGARSCTALKRGRELGFPTANLAPDLEGFVPADGVYAGWLIDEGSADGLRSGMRYPAAISIGVNPHFDDVEVRQVEAYVLDETDLDLYGHRVEVQFVRAHPRHGGLRGRRRRSWRRSPTTCVGCGPHSAEVRCGAGIDPWHRPRLRSSRGRPDPAARSRRPRRRPTP